MKIAAIDIGTNSIHMIVVATDEAGSYEVVDKEKAMVRLGCGAFRHRRLTDRAFGEGLDAIRRFAKLAERHGADEILAVATSAIRETENGGDFLDAVRDQTGIQPRVISGTEEARLIFRAVANAIDLGDDNVLVLDLGGGSMEAIVGGRLGVRWSTSLRLGVQRLRDKLGHDDALGSSERKKMAGFVGHTLEDAMRRAREVGFSRVIGTSGSIRELAEKAHERAGGDPWRTTNAETVGLEAIRDLVDDLLKMDRDDRAEVVDGGRADAIHLGGLVLVRSLEQTGVQEITLCDDALREGVVLDHIRRAPVEQEDFSHLPDVRRRSVAHLARKYGADTPHEAHVARLAVQLFDETREVHGMGEWEREILEAAARLHTVGQYVHFKKHHKHARYIIHHSRLRGFTDEELTLVGHVARYQRRKRPKKKHKKLGKLTEARRRIVRVLSGLLRLAIGLDRSRNQLVEGVDADALEDQLRIDVKGRGRSDLELELWAARRKSSALADAFDRDVEVRAAG